MQKQSTSAHRPALTRRGLIGFGGLVALTSLTACQSDPESTSHPTGGSSPHETTLPKIASPGDAIERLKVGNARFAAGQAMHPHQDGQAREAVAEHQHPWALVHGCVDSRVTAELVFDQGIGDLFATRTAAAVLDDTIVGSMEFALGAPYQVPLIVIMGHTACGAVTATVNALKASPTNPTAPGEVLDIVREIAPVARSVPANPDPAAYIDDVVRANTTAVARGLVLRSKIVRDAVKAGHTRVVAAIYDLETGVVTWLPDPV